MFKISDAVRTVPIDFQGFVYHLRYPNGCPFKVSLLAQELVGLAGAEGDVSHLSSVIQQMFDLMFEGDVPEAADMNGQQVMELMEYFHSLSEDAEDVHPGPA